MDSCINATNFGIYSEDVLYPDYNLQTRTFRTGPPTEIIYANCILLSTTYVLGGNHFNSLINLKLIKPYFLI
jgi:hypothetical protein